MAVSAAASFVDSRWTAPELRLVPEPLVRTTPEDDGAGPAGLIMSGRRTLS